MARQPETMLSVIVPVHNGEPMLRESLPALRASDLPQERWELIVVDDSSTDGTSAVAARFADRVVRLQGLPRGPAHARNRGSEAAVGEILAFIDADVCVHEDALRRFLEILAAEPDVVAVFGAYDLEPPARGMVSQYRNLLHHYIHARQAGEADTFWAGCGAIRRTAFLAAEGFDEERYGRPQIEDIALGYRLRSLGHRILLRPEIQGTHLKRWTLGGMVRCDLLDRGIPWMRLLLDGGGVGSGSLNVRPTERWLTAAAGLGAVAGAFGIVLRSGWLLAFAGLCLVSVVLGNWPMLKWFSMLRSRRFALGAVPLRLLYYLLNAAAVGIALFQHVASMVVGRRPARFAEDGVKRSAADVSPPTEVPLEPRG
jgi:hypothetical protein